MKAYVLVKIGLLAIVILLCIWNQNTAIGKEEKLEGENSVQSPFVGVERDARLGSEITKTRSFLYAPPPMPHQGMKQRDCMKCHAPFNDIKKKWRSIRPVAHKSYSQCYQCHVPQRRGEDAPFTESDFLALDLPGEGSRNNDFSPRLYHTKYLCVKTVCLATARRDTATTVRRIQSVRSVCNATFRKHQ